MRNNHSLRNFLVLNRQKHHSQPALKPCSTNPNSTPKFLLRVDPSERDRKYYVDIDLNYGRKKWRSRKYLMRNKKDRDSFLVRGADNLDVHHSCRGWWRWFQFFRQRNISIALMFLLSFGRLYSFEHHNTSNSPLQTPHPDLSYPFLSVSSLIAASIHSSQSTWAPKTCSQWSLFHQTKTPLDVLFTHRVTAKIQCRENWQCRQINLEIDKLEHWYNQFRSRSKTSRSAADRSPCRLLCPICQLH